MLNVTGKEVVYIYRWREKPDDDIWFIRALIHGQPSISRYAIARKMCRKWNWVRANVAYKKGIYQSLLAKLGSAGLVELPPRKKFSSHSPVARPEADISRSGSKPDRTTKAVKPMDLVQITRTDQEKVDNGLI